MTDNQAGPESIEPPPGPLARLPELASNLWWSWNPEARTLFRDLDPTLWHLTKHNPVKLLQDIKPERLLALAADPAFLLRYSAVLKTYDTYMEASGRWFAGNQPDGPGSSIAYFSAEFGLHNSIPIYSGGLGILAGDHCKEASDLGIPLVGLGFMYPQGYFRQRLSSEGWQEAEYDLFNRRESPMRQSLTSSQSPCQIQVEVADRLVSVAVWEIWVGRVPLYLLDTDVPENDPQDRQLSARLYGGDQEIRLRQELVLGIGGVRALRALGVNPAVWHANEGHSAFQVLERIRELVQGGHTFDQAVALTRHQTIFTTHTPVPAGHDVFPHHLMERYFSRLWEQLALSREAFLDLGTLPDAQRSGFNMTALAIRMSSQVNGVSREHGRVSRQMWRNLWPGVSEDEVPIRSVTNGIHAPTWVAGEMHHLYGKYLGPDWADRCDDPATWHRVSDIPDRELWATRQELKRKLRRLMRERARARWMQRPEEWSQVLAEGVLLDPNALTLGFARRFATYKRATLLFAQLDRLRPLLLDPWRPVQIIFAGKAHPADEPAREFIHQVYTYCKDHALGGRLAFLEDYDMHLAKHVIQGVDVWLNTPRQPLEACGTSGQKAALNGVPNLSTLDGWWKEGYTGTNGWAIPALPDCPDPQAQDAHDAEHLYRLLEQEVVPLYYTRDSDDIPRGWIHLVKDSIRSIMPQFCSRRMVKEYAHMYRHAVTEPHASP